MWKAKSAIIITIGLIMSLSCGGRYDLADELKSLIIVFRPHPVNGIKSTENSKPSSASLQWAPVYADISVSGDLGYTTGPWEYRPGGIEDTAVVHGSYISVWKKQADGGWRVILDTGISNPAPTLALTDIQTETGLKFSIPNNRRENHGKERQDLIDIDRRGSEKCEFDGTVDFYEKNCTDDIRFFRDMVMPLTGKNHVIDYYSDNPGRFTWSPVDAFISEQADFGYSYGLARFEAEAQESAEIQYGYYMRIWRRSDNGHWKIALDVISPSPPPRDDKT
jgi:ketosteroid isomerase-like protein